MRSKTALVVVVHAEDEAAVDHHAQIVQPADGGVVIAVEVLVLVLRAQVGRAERLEADEQAAQAAGGGLLDQAAAAGSNPRWRPPATADPCPCMPSNSAAAKLRVAEQVIVEEVEVPAGQALDLGQRGIDGLRVERLAAAKERFLVAEVAVCGQPRETTIEFGTRYRCRLIRSRRIGGMPDRACAPSDR